MLHIDAARVKMERAVDSEPASFPPYDVFPPDPDWVPASGTLSLPIAASAEKGALIVDHCVASMISHFCGCFMMRSLRVIAVLMVCPRAGDFKSPWCVSTAAPRALILLPSAGERAAGPAGGATSHKRSGTGTADIIQCRLERGCRGAVHRRGKQTRSVNSQVSGQGERPRKRRSTVC